MPEQCPKNLPNHLPRVLCRDIFIHGLRVYNKGQAFKLVDKAVNLLSNIPDVHEFTLSSLDFLVEELVFAQMKKSDIDGFTELNSDTVWDNLVEPTISL